jgi:protein-S-isoprenylcysteine O-methyltransferase Ste14
MKQWHDALLPRALVAFLALPGVVAIALPILIAQATHKTPRPGLLGPVLGLAGLAALVWCTWAFYTTGRGTLAPWSPPRQLVTHGLYRYSRNPMYCAVLLLLAGWAFLFQAVELALYAAVVGIAFHARVVLGEEPWLERTHGDEWRAYKAKVGRWIGTAAPAARDDA